MNNRTKSAGLTAQVINFPVNPAVSPDVISRRRVVIERPAPQPVRRECPYCGAAFDDFTQRPNTLYCRPGCRVMMSRLKKRLAIEMLATVSRAPQDKIAETVETGGLAQAEKLLEQFGYTFLIVTKSWIKKGQS